MKTNLKRQQKEMSQIRNIRLLLSLACIALLAGCQNEPGEPENGQQQYTMELIPLSTHFVDIQRMGTRADYENHLPVGYISFNELYPTTTPPNKTIGVFMTPERESSLGDFIYQGIEDGVSIWKSTVTVIEGHEYYIYGFMPHGDADRAVITPLPTANTSGTDRGYAEGAVLTIQNYESLTAADVCVVVGVRNATAEEKITGPDTDIKLGSFGYLGGAVGDNRIFVLLKHIYAGIHFKARIDPEYHRLRSIKVTNFELIANGISEKVNLLVTFTANSTGDDPVSPTSVTYSPVGEPTSASTTLFPWEDGPEFYEITETAPESFLGCFVPNSCRDFVLRTTYNVYDTEGNLIREGNVVENQINSTLIPELGNTDAGDIVTVNLLIKPSFMYVLSDPDLDNPDFKLTTP